VNRHIGAFGGDASRITITGGSAGGGAVMNQMIMYGGEANPPFQAVLAGKSANFWLARVCITRHNLKRLTV